MKTSKSHFQSFFALQLDISKAYDKVEWKFLEKVLTRLGFASSFTNLVIRCISFVLYSLLVNGRPTKSFQPTRGLRQRDPSSQLLFMFVAEAFSAILARPTQLRTIQVAKICRIAHEIPHLFFADDSVIFGRACQGNLSSVMDIINKLYKHLHP